MRYLARTHSSPLVAFATPPTHDAGLPINLVTKAVPDDGDSTGVVYDESMLRHHCPCNDNGVHLENPSRIQVGVILLYPLSEYVLSIYQMYLRKDR